MRSNTARRTQEELKQERAFRSKIRFELADPNIESDELLNRLKFLLQEQLGTSNLAIELYEENGAGLTRAQREQKATIAANLTSKLQEHNAAVLLFNETVKRLFGDAAKTGDALNEAIDQAETWATEVYDSMNEAFDERDEDWQESDEGQRFERMKDAWDVDFSEGKAEIDADSADNFLLENEDVDAAKTFSDLPNCIDDIDDVDDD